ncbi:galectin-4-like [Syngnathoides biaculeatus]|uniref:galectin-4-like n=1 Tax=Syngnathoides biaculeatus TaxID=300417 RepID=UPI002ADD8AC6|nr:galectin-4-like [Syngnathoides biaculeatus]
MSFLAPPGYQPVYAPTIPYIGPIYGGLREGASIYIQGSVPGNITRFFVNLLCGPSESSDIALHFNPRFDGWDKVVFNSRQNNAWDAEEKIRDMPFSKGKAFEMVVACSAHGYQFKINGKDFHTFKHRLPLSRVSGMQIGGDVSIQTINVIGQHQGGYPGGGMGQQQHGGYPGGSMGARPGCGVAYPGDCAGQGGYPGGMGGNVGGGFPGSNLPSMSGQPIYNPPIPYSAMIPGGMFPKRTIIIRGNVPERANRFSINFLASRCGDIALHINPRVSDSVVVRNSMIGGRWGQEERQLAANPFKAGQYFDLSIRCAGDRFKVFIDGQPLFDYNHRVRALGDIDKLDVAGDVRISYVHF